MSLALPSPLSMPLRTSLAGFSPTKGALQKPSRGLFLLTCFCFPSVHEGGWGMKSCSTSREEDLGGLGASSWSWQLYGQEDLGVEQEGAWGSQFG